MTPSLTTQALFVKQTQPLRVFPSKSEVILVIFPRVAFESGTGGAGVSCAAGAAAGGGFVPVCANRLVESITLKSTEQVDFMVTKSTATNPFTVKHRFCL